MPNYSTSSDTERLDCCSRASERDCSSQPQHAPLRAATRVDKNGSIRVASSVRKNTTFNRIPVLPQDIKLSQLSRNVITPEGPDWAWPVFRFLSLAEQRRGRNAKQTFIIAENLPRTSCTSLQPPSRHLGTLTRFLYQPGSSYLGGSRFLC